MSFLTPQFLYSQFLFKPAYPTTSFADQTVIVTGSNIGLGREAARHFARLKCSKLILAVRNTAAGEAAKTSIIETTSCPASSVEVWPLDLSSYSSVLSFAQRASSLPRLDVLLCNAGVAKIAYTPAENHESTITINVISTFLLSLLLLPKLQSTAKQHPKSPKPRLTIVSSEVHTLPKFPERDAPDIFSALDTSASPSSEDGKRGIGMAERYPTSKLLEVLICRYLAPKLSKSSPGVVLNYLNPGLCHSSLSRDVDKWVFTLMKFLLARSTEVGSRTLVAAAVAGEESHGKYMSDGKVADERLSAFARSEEGKEVGEKLWKELKKILEGIKGGVTRDL